MEEKYKHKVITIPNTISCWDKLLHISGGVMFAILGAYFFDLLVKERVHSAARAIFALCFSMTIAILWEFCKFGADRFLDVLEVLLGANNKEPKQNGSARQYAV